MADSTYESVPQLAESLSRDEQLRLIEELMTLTASSEAARVMELRRHVAELKTTEANMDALFDVLRERNVPAATSPTSSAPSNDLDELFERLRRMPVRDPRSPDEIMGYDSLGLSR